MEPVHVELQEKTLVVKRHDMVYEDVMANYVSFIICYFIFSYVAEICPNYTLY